jgi:hypothetical protein
VAILVGMQLSCDVLIEAPLVGRTFRTHALNDKVQGCIKEFVHQIHLMELQGQGATTVAVLQILLGLFLRGEVYLTLQQSLGRLLITGQYVRHAIEKLLLSIGEKLIF